MEHLLARIYSIADNPPALAAVLFISALANSLFPPVPVELAAVFAGYLVSQGHGSLPVVIGATTAGMFIGSFTLYLTARHYGPALVARRPFNRILKEKDLDRFSRWFEKYGVWSFFLAKFVPGLSFAAIFAGGTLKLSRTKALAGLLASNLLVFSLLVLLGFTVGDEWRRVYTLFGSISTGIFLVLIIVCAALYLLFWRHEKKRP